MKYMLEIRDGLTDYLATTYREETDPSVTFHEDFQALREKYPMVYLEAWTPDDFVNNDFDEDGDFTPKPVDWNDPDHITTANNLNRHFDAEFGTNWDRIRYESVSTK